MKANRVFLLSSILLIFTVVFIAGCGKKNEGRDASYTMTGMTTIESVDGKAIEKSTLSEEDYNVYVESVDGIFDEVSNYQDRKLTKKFICAVCGYIHEGDSAPEKCPICKAPASKFSELKDDGDVTYATVHRIGDGKPEGVSQEMIEINPSPLL